MSKLIDMTGWIMAEHGIPNSRLTVIERGENSKNGQARWWCRCNCGNKDLKLIKGCHIRSGKILSCGCFIREYARKAFSKQNRYNMDGDFAIGYTEKGEEFWVDKQFVPKLKYFYFWYNSNGYLRAVNPSNDPLGLGVRTVYLHMIVMDAYNPEINPNKMFVDHKNHPKRNEKKIDNRLSNLRFVSNGQNNQNQCLSKRNKSGVTGVVFRKELNKWLAQIVVNKQHISLGVYENINDAIKARKEAEIKYFGEYRYDAYNTNNNTK